MSFTQSLFRCYEGLFYMKSLRNNNRKSEPYASTTCQWSDLGSVYALLALGYTMVYGIIKLINFAHGDIYMMGAFMGYFLINSFQINFFVL